MDMQTRYRDALTFEQFVDAAQKNQQLWRDVHRLARPSDDVVARVNALPARRNLLVLVEDWCGDAVNIVPPLVRLADATGRLDVRLLSRDQNPDLMDAHLTNGSRSIPVVMVLDEQFRECAWWGPRPSELQEWVLRVGLKMDKQERYKIIRAWYARDHAATTLQEVVRLLEGCNGAVGAGAAPYERASA